MLLERKTVEKAEEAIKRMGWDLDDAYYGAEHCARLRAWAEKDWAQAKEEEAEAEEARRAAAHEDTSSDDSSSAPDTPRSATTAATRRRHAKQSPTDAGLRDAKKPATQTSMRHFFAPLAGSLHSAAKDGDSDPEPDPDSEPEPAPDAAVVSPRLPARGSTQDEDSHASDSGPEDMLLDLPLVAVPFDVPWGNFSVTPLGRLVAECDQARGLAAGSIYSVDLGQHCQDSDGVVNSNMSARNTQPRAIQASLAAAETSPA